MNAGPSRADSVIEVHKVLRSRGLPLHQQQPAQYTTSLVYIFCSRVSAKQIYIVEVLKLSRWYVTYLQGLNRVSGHGVKVTVEGMQYAV